MDIKEAKADHKRSLLHKSKYITQRDRLVEHLLQCRTPRWGSLKVILVDW